MREKGQEERRLNDRAAVDFFSSGLFLRSLTGDSRRMVFGICRQPLVAGATPEAGHGKFCGNGGTETCKRFYFI